MLKTHEILSELMAARLPRAALHPHLAAAISQFQNLQAFEKLHERPGNTNVTGITETTPGLAAVWRPRLRGTLASPYPARKYVN
jgi:hypothetical protein